MGNPLVILELALKVWALILEGMTIEQRQVMMQRFIDDTGAAREKWDRVVSWFVGLIIRAAAKDAKAAEMGQ